MALILDTQAYLDTVCELLQAGHTHIPVTIAGTSMTPFLDPGDTVFLDLPKHPIQMGDIILFSRSGNQYILHRVVGIRTNGVLELLGDAQVIAEPVVPEQVRAIVTGANRSGKLLDRNSLRWRFFRGPWRYLRRSRPLINRIRNRILRMYKKDEA